MQNLEAIEADPGGYEYDDPKIDSGGTDMYDDPNGMKELRIEGVSVRL